ncbi:putative retrotransposon hot spot protein (RHS,) [Trypanosoma cruzi]|uniref:Putative retrotransposon hot spot protein (RHS,) n=1 Tax=Trypanosoma cruzi TaxID=5693 RepID=A0A2V2UNQ9_TRYCR|nr:putative retrotransposon hot spot protein (RHS,) [Trypanosoma cruzi]
MLAAGRPLMKDYNVTMEVFVREPDDYAQDQRFLEEILNLTAYQALEAITKPLQEGVLSLGQRGNYERKGYDHSFCKGKTKRGTHAGTDRSAAGGSGKAKRNARNEIYHFHYDRRGTVWRKSSRQGHKAERLSYEGTGRQGRFGRQSGCLAGGVFQGPHEVYP